MAEISITTKLEELKVLFNQMKEVYYVSKVNSDLATLAAVSYTHLQRSFVRVESPQQ